MPTSHLRSDIRDQLGVVVRPDGRQTPSRAEYGPAVREAIARWHDDCVPVVFARLYDSFQLGIDKRR
jgi:hypothetical protein